MKTLAGITTTFLFLIFYALTPPGAFEALIAVTQEAAQPRAPEPLIYDAHARRLVLLTASRQAEREQLWGWDGKQWAFIPSAGPSARGGVPSLAYDSDRKKVVLFGGWDATGAVSDIWEWEGKQWTRIK